MSRKNVLAPTTALASAQSLGASFNTNATIIDYMDNCSYQINATTSDAVGTFKVQASLDYEAGNSLNNARTGNWVDLTLSGTPSLSSANDNIIINLNQVPFRAIRLVYTRTSGTGTVDIYVMNKSIGA